MFLLFVIASFLFFSVFHVNPEENVAGIIFQVVLVLIFIGGMILGFFVYKKTARWYIKKFNMKDKLNEEVLIHYFKEEELDIEDKRLK